MLKRCLNPLVANFMSSLSPPARGGGILAISSCSCRYLGSLLRCQHVCYQQGQAANGQAKDKAAMPPATTRTAQLDLLTHLFSYSVDDTSWPKVAGLMARSSLSLYRLCLNLKSSKLQRIYDDTVNVSTGVHFLMHMQVVPTGQRLARALSTAHRTLPQQILQELDCKCDGVRRALRGPPGDSIMQKAARQRIGRVSSFSQCL